MCFPHHYRNHEILLLYIFFLIIFVFYDPLNTRVSLCDQLHRFSSQRVLFALGALDTMEKRAQIVKVLFWCGPVTQEAISQHSIQSCAVGSERAVRSEALN